MKLLSILTAAILSISSLCYAGTTRKPLNDDFTLGTELLTDGDFEGGYFGGPSYGLSGSNGRTYTGVNGPYFEGWSWRNNPEFNNPITQSPRGTPCRNYTAWCGYFDPFGDSSLYQVVQIPSGTVDILTFWAWVGTFENTPNLVYDTMKVSVTDVTSGPGIDFMIPPTGLTVSNLNANSNWVKYTLNVSAFAGRTIRLSFDTHETDINGTTLFEIDDVSINSQSNGTPPSYGNCQTDPYTMCLMNGRYKVTSTWKDQYDVNIGLQNLEAASITSNVGAFWYFNADQYEYFVRVLPGNNGRAWVQISMFNNVEFWVTVTDTVNGQTKTYYNPPGNETLIYDPWFFVFP
jgi:hypothetical protein